MYMLELIPAGICGVMPGLGITDLLARSFRMAREGVRKEAYRVFKEALPQIVFSLRIWNFTDLLELESDRGHGISLAQKCSPVKFRSLPHSRAIGMALFPLRNPMIDATGCFGGIAMHIWT
jgi:hypothetical protein